MGGKSSFWTHDIATSEPMDFDLGLLADSLGGKELFNLRTLISLELNDTAEFLIVNDDTVACKLLLDKLQDLLRVEF